VRRKDPAGWRMYMINRLARRRVSGRSFRPLRENRGSSIAVPSSSYRRGDTELAPYATQLRGTEQRTASDTT